MAMYFPHPVKAHHYGPTACGPSPCESSERLCVGVVAQTDLVGRSQDSLAEWSKALASGASPQGRGFEPHSCQSGRQAGRQAGKQAVSQSVGRVYPAGEFIPQASLSRASLSAGEFVRGRVYPAGDFVAGEFIRGRVCCGRVCPRASLSPESLSWPSLSRASLSRASLSHPICGVAGRDAQTKV